MTADPRIAAGYAACAAATRRAGTSFALGIRLLPSDRRRALTAVYWFSRLADDAADDGAPEMGRARLAWARRDLDRALAGDPPAEPWVALADATHRYGVPPSLYHALLDGVGRDLEPLVLPDWEATRAYCHGVASVVGLAALRIYGGGGPAAERAADDLGVALQLTNILRDLREDAARGRWYLPLNETRAFGVAVADVARGRAGGGFDALVAAQVERARALYATGGRLYGHLPAATRASPAALAGVYRGLLEQIAARPRAVLEGRVRLSAPSRIAWGLGSALRSLTA